MIGADKMALEVLPGTNHPQEIMPVHQHSLAEAGVHIIENRVMDGLIEKDVPLVAALPPQEHDE